MGLLEASPNIPADIFLMRLLPNNIPIAYPEGSPVFIYATTLIYTLATVATFRLHIYVNYFIKIDYYGNNS